MNKSLLSYLLAGCVFLVISMGYSQTPTLVKDVNIVHTSLGGVEETITFNGYVYFVQDDGTNGSEVWRTDGTTTEMFTDIDNATHGDPFSLTVWNNLLYFSTDIMGVWKSDGTVPGTESFTTLSGTIIPASTKLYIFNDSFKALSITDGVFGGSSIGILGNPGPNILGNAGYNFTTLLDGIFYVINDIGTTGTELMFFDGLIDIQTNNPVNDPVVIDVYPGTDGSFPASLNVLNNKLYFISVSEQLGFTNNNDGLGPKSVFESDGTVMGTVKKVDLQGLLSRTPEFIEMTSFNGKLYYNEVSGNITALNSFDGTIQNFEHIFTNNNLITAFKYVRFDAEINGILYFRAYDGNVSMHWQTDGATVTTSALQLGVSIFSREHAVIPGQVIYSKHPNTSQELFSTTLAGAESSLYDFNNSNELAPSKFTVLGTDAYFVANQDDDGSQLWKTDGTTTTQVTTNGITSTNGSNPTDIIEQLGNLYFSADNRIDGVQLYKTDGTAPNTVVTADAVGKSGGVMFNGEYYYTLGISTNDALWKTDGTTATQIFQVTNHISELTVSGSNLFFYTHTTNEGQEVWVSDGTVGNKQVLDMAAGGTFNTYPVDLVDVNGTLYFTGIDLNKGTRGLWKSDGTFAGTTVVYNVDYDFPYLTRFDDNLFFIVDDLFNGIEPMVYNHGSEEFQTFDLNESGDSEPYGFQEMNGEYYFFTKAPKALWKYDGSIPENAVVVASLPNSASTTVGNVFASSNQLFYNYNNVQYTYNGTDLNTFTASMNQPITIGNMVYYKSVSTKYELWETDGTTEGTKYIVDISASDKLFSFNSELYFAYDDGLLGRELYKYQSAKQGFALTANSALNFTDNTFIDLSLDWTTGNGDGRIVLISTVENMALPEDGVTYAANTVFGSSALGSSTDTFVIGNGDIAATDVTTLDYGTSYYFSIVEYTEPTAGNFLYDRQNIYRTTLGTAILQPLIDYAETPQQTYGNGTFTLAAETDSTVPVTFAYVSGPGSVNGNVVTVIGAGDIVVEYRVDADGGMYGEVSLQVTIPIAKASITATVTDETRAYGDSNPAFNVDYSGFATGEDATVLDSAPIPSTTADVTSNAATYDIVLTAGSDNNYEITNVEAILTVSKATLTANVNNASKTYGEANPSFTFSYSGFANGEDETVIDTSPTVSTSADVTSEVGSFSITATGGADTNYEITPNDGFLTINKASLSAVINDQERQYGQQNIDATLTYTGFLNGDTAADIDTPPATSTTATNISDVGTYAIIAANTGSDNNYDITTPTSGTLTIIKADQLITMEDIADQDYSISDQIFVTSTITSSLQISLSISGPAAIDGNLIRLDATSGTVVVTASQAGDANHNEATDVSVSFEAFTSDPCFDFDVSLIGSTFNTCSGGTEGSMDIVVTGGDGNYTYSWSSGEDTEDITNLAGGTYTITVTDGNDCSGTFTETIIDPDPIVTPIIIADNNNAESTTLSVSNDSGGNSYEWFLNGNFHSSNSSIVLDEEGGYTVVATSNNCVSETSDSYDFAKVIAGMDDLLTSTFKIYPNPSQGIINLELNDIQKATIKMQSIDGKLAKDFGVQTGAEIQLDVSGLLPGIYLLQLINKGDMQTQKFILE